MSTMSQEAAALSRAADHVRQGQADVTRMCTGLTTQMQAVGPQWRGGGGVSFQNLMTIWADRQRKIVGALEGLSAALEATERDNVATDQDQAAASARLAGRLG